MCIYVFYIAPCTTYDGVPNCTQGGVIRSMYNIFYEVSTFFHTGLKKILIWLMYVPCPIRSLIELLERHSKVQMLTRHYVPPSFSTDTLVCILFLRCIIRFILRYVICIFIRQGYCQGIRYGILRCVPHILYSLFFMFFMLSPSLRLPLIISHLYYVFFHTLRYIYLMTLHLTFSYVFLLILTYLNTFSPHRYFLFTVFSLVLGCFSLQYCFLVSRFKHLYN